MSETIALKSIYDLLGLNFFIPSYQRGYRWTKQQVEDLLEDILDFTRKKNKDEGEFYCLQPIVLKTCDEDIINLNSLESDLDNNKWYEVIDGQQRLTTLYIIISYFVRFLGGETLQMAYGREKFVLEYETRRSTHHFLENISDSFENIDCEYIYQAYKTVDNWFSKQEQPKMARDEFMNTLLAKDDRNNVRVIWYELSAKDLPKGDNRSVAIDSFTRLNIGKIPLTNAELVKALFLQKRNFADDDVNLRQIEIAKEWDQMEHALQQEKFWAFLNKKKKKAQ